MNISINYERLSPSTVSGDAIKVTYIYSSFNSKEVDELEEQLRKEIGSGIISKAKEM